MSIRSTLQKLIDPNTTDEVRTLSDIELKTALTKAATELQARGYELHGWSGKHPISIYVSKRVEL